MYLCVTREEGVCACLRVYIGMYMGISAYAFKCEHICVPVSTCVSVYASECARISVYAHVGGNMCAYECVYLPGGCAMKGR